jgi:hypothetical protein
VKEPSVVSRPVDDPAALRAEHDELARRLAVRTSVDLVERGGVMTFFTVIAFGMTCKLAWDRWGWLPAPRPTPPGLPVYFLVGVLLTLVLLFVATRAFVRAGRLRREEDLHFARFRELRQRLGLDS